MSDLLRGLNPEQLEAVRTTDGPLLVLAGAGTGKTRVITHRIAHLFEKGVAPENVLAVTFTTKAAREMRERVGRLVGKERAERLLVGTFHAFCLEALRAHGEALGVPSTFTISDGSDQLSIVRRLMRQVDVAGATMQPGELHGRISLAKNRGLESAGFLKAAKDDDDELVGRVWARYEEELRRVRSLDFDDLLTYTVRLLKKRNGPRAAFRERFRYVLVDEYQDTNAIQYEIVRAIAGGHGNLCVVGDDDQSIYGWRGADVAKILAFPKDFPGTRTVRLERNYRSTEPILKAANRVIRNNPKRHEKTLVAARGSGDPVMLVHADDETEEADHVARDVVRLVAAREARYRDFAVLFRTGPQARAFEGQLRARNVPYVLVGGQSFFDRKEVRDVLAYLRLLLHPDDDHSLMRVANAPPRGLGKVSLERILRHATDQGIDACAAMEAAPAIDRLSAGAGAAAQGLARSLETVRRMEGTPLVGRIQTLLEAVDYQREVQRSYPDELTRTQRWQAVSEILDFAENHARRAKDPTLASFLQELALEAAEDTKDEDTGERDVVTLMTLHSAKGLEFPRVYLVGLEEGLLPHARSVDEDTVEEERRLCYVGITRAQRHLTLCHTRTRSRYGQRAESVPSRFLAEARGDEWAPPKAPGAKKTGRGARGRRKPSTRASGRRRRAGRG